MNKTSSWQCMSCLRHSAKFVPLFHYGRTASTLSIRNHYEAVSRDEKSADVRERTSWTDIIDQAKKSKVINDVKLKPRISQAQRMRTSSLDKIRSLRSDKLSYHLLSFQRAGLWTHVVDLYLKYYGTSVAPSTHIPSARAFHFFVRAQCMMKNHQAIQWILQNMLETPQDLKYDVETANVLLYHYVQSGDVSKAIDILNALYMGNFALDTISYNTVLDGGRYGEGNIEHIKIMLKLMRQRNVPYTAETYNILIAAYKQLNLFSQVRRCFFDALEAKKANTETFNTIIAMHLSKGRWQEGWSLLLMMRERGLPRDEATYSPFLLYLERGDHSNHLPALVNQIKADNVLLGTPSFNILLHGLLFSGQLTQSEVLLRDLVDGTVAASEKTFDTILHFYRSCSTSFLQKPLHSLFMELLEVEVIRNSAVLAYHSVLVLRMSNMAWIRLDPAKAATLPLAEPANVSHKSSSHFCKMQTLLRAGQWQRALAYHDSFSIKGLIAPVEIVGTLILGLIRLGQLEQAQRVYQEAKHDLSLRTNLKFQTIIIGTFDRHSVKEDLQRLFSFLRVNDVKLDLIFYTAAAWRLYRDEHFQEVISLLKHVITLGLALDLVAWILLVECYAKVQNLMGTIWCLQAMKDNKILLDKLARNRLKRTIRRFDEEKDAAHVDHARGLLHQLPTRQRLQKPAPREHHLCLIQHSASTSSSEMQPLQSAVST